MNIVRKDIDQSNATLTLRIEKADYAEKVQKTLRDYRKKANIPGFRPGMVPVGLITKMYGKAVIAEEINKIVSSMSSEEQAVMAESREYQLAKQTYEAGFLGYLGSKFAVEYVTTPDGKIAANNLLTTIKQQKERVNEGLRAKQQKIDKLLNLLENDPDLKKKYEEMLTNNQ